ncbi:MAG: rhomboid family intramembrane serine protease [Armatimonas sp.]
MLPLYDDNPTRTKPYVTWTLVALNVLVYLLQVTTTQWSPYGARGPLAGWMLVPAELTQGLRAPTNGLDGPPAFLTLFTCMFLHGGLLHLLGNMLFLIIFGNNIEDALGRVKYIFFYLLCGLAAGLTQVMANPASTVPIVGASGAIAGVLGAYMLLYPKARVNTLVFLVVFITRVAVPAWLLLSFWILSQFFNQFTHALGGGEDKGGVAYLAHIGGFLAGMLLIKVFGAKGHSPEPSYQVRYPDEG